MQQEAIHGVVEEVRIQKEDTGWAVLMVSLSGEKEPSCVTGVAPIIHPGCGIEAEGAWEDSRFGRQFKARSLRIKTPHTAEGIVRFLASGAIEHIGEKFARKLVKAFGEKTLDIAMNDHLALRCIRGVGEKRIKALRDGLKAHVEKVDVMTFLHEHFGPARADKIFRRWGVEAQSKVNSNPYCLLDIDGIGFLIADKVALEMGLARESNARIDAGILHELHEIQKAGHLAAMRNSLIGSASKLLGARPERVIERLDVMIGDERVIAEDAAAGDQYLFAPNAHRAETRLAEDLARLVKAPSNLPSIIVPKALQWVERVIGLSLSGEQRNAITTSLENPVSVITGEPGTGKTTILLALVSILRAKGVEILMAAPTGRAARRMNESTSHPASTIHRMLGYNPDGGFSHDDKNPLPAQALLLDESSMIDVFLGRSTLQAVPDGAMVVFVGDVDQLPSVMGGRVLGDLIESRRIPVSRLTEPRRQAANSGIIAAAHAINKGATPDLTNTRDDFQFQETRNSEHTAAGVLYYVTKALPEEGFQPATDIQVITPQYRGPCGVDALNSQLQKALNPNPPEYIDRFGVRYAVGDKVLQTKNNADLDIYNGDIGFITSIDTAGKTFKARFDDRHVELEWSKLDQMTLGYAITVHRSQGGEYPACVIACDMAHANSLDRQLLYTAVSRGKQRVQLLGQARAVGMAVSAKKIVNRLTRLAYRLAELLPVAA